MPPKCVYIEFYINSHLSVKFFLIILIKENKELCRKTSFLAKQSSAKIPYRIPHSKPTNSNNREEHHKNIRIMHANRISIYYKGAR